jgi:SAM-dependent methyltransferase
MNRDALAREMRRIWSQIRKTGLRARIGQQWDAGGALSQRVYPDYETYLTHQRLKLDAYRVSSVERHDRHFYAELSGRLERCPVPLAGRSVLCLAARIGTEVRAFIDRGAFAVGIDLNPGKDNRWVVVGDFHRLQFADASVDVVYTNSLDHVFELERVIAEVHRVLKPEGTFLVEMGLGTEEGGAPGFYEALAWKRVDELIGRIEAVGFREWDRAPADPEWQGVQTALAKI